MVAETMQGRNLLIGSNEGFRVLLKDTLTLTLGKPGIESPSECSPGHSMGAQQNVLNKASSQSLKPLHPCICW